MPSNREILEHALASFNDPDRRDQYMGLYAEDAKLYGYHGVEPGREGIRRFYEAIWTAFPDAVVRVEHIVESGEELAARLTMTALHEGPLMGIPPTGLAVNMPIITILRFHNGEVVERWSQADLFGVFQQIGAFPPAA